MRDLRGVKASVPAISLYGRLEGSAADMPERLARPPKRYDCAVDDFREVVQGDVDFLEDLCEAYGLAHKIVRRAFFPHGQLEELLKGLRELDRRLELSQAAP